MLNPGIKKAIVLLMLAYIVFVNSGYTDADIFAERIVSANKLTATSLDFSVYSSFNNRVVYNLFNSPGIEPSGFDLGALKLATDIERRFNYHLKVTKLNGDDNFCNSLDLKIYDRNFFLLYKGSLMEASLKSNLAKDNPRSYIFFLSLDEASTEIANQLCEFNFNFRTYNDNIDEEGGIFAERKINNIVTRGSW